MQQMELKDYFRQRHKFDIFRFSSVWLGRRVRERGIDQLRPGEQILPFHRWWRLKGPWGESDGGLVWRKSVEEQVGNYVRGRWELVCSHPSWNFGWWR